MDFFERLTELRKAKGVTQKQITEDLNLGKNSFTGWREGVRPNSSTQKVLADYFGVSVDYLMGKTDNRSILIGGQIAACYPYEKRGLRPVVGIASAGNGIFVQENILGYAPVDAKFNNENFFWLEVSGDSMSPKIDNGDLVLIQKDGEIDNGCLAIAIVDDTDGFLKQIYASGNSVTLHSFNPYYPDRVFRGKEQARLRFVGRARKVERTL